MSRSIASVGLLCAVCLELESPHQTCHGSTDWGAIARCGHTFHKACLAKSYEKSPFECPTCRHSHSNSKPKVPSTLHFEREQDPAPSETQPESQLSSPPRPGGVTDRVRELQAQSRELRNTLSDVKKERDELRVKAEECEALRGEVERLRTRMDPMVELLAERNEVIQGLDKEVNELRAGQPDLQAQLEEMKDKKDKYRAKVKDKEKELKEKDEEYEMRLSNASSQNEEVLRQFQEERSREVKELRDENTKLLKSIRENGNEGANKIRELNQKIKSLTSDHTQEREAWDVLKQRYQSQLEDRQEEVDKFRKLRDDAKATFDAQTALLEKERAESKRLRNGNLNYQKIVETLKAQLTHLKSTTTHRTGIISPLSSPVKAKSNASPQKNPKASTSRNLSRSDSSSPLPFKINNRSAILSSPKKQASIPLSTFEDDDEDELEYVRGDHEGEEEEEEGQEEEEEDSDDCVIVEDYQPKKKSILPLLGGSGSKSTGSRPGSGSKNGNPFAEDRKRPLEKSKSDKWLPNFGQGVYEKGPKKKAKRT